LASLLCRGITGRAQASAPHPQIGPYVQRPIQSADHICIAFGGGTVQNLRFVSKTESCHTSSTCKVRAVHRRFLAFGLSALVFDACAETHQSARHPSVPAQVAPKVIQVISNPSGAAVAVNQEYSGDVIAFPAEVESGNYTVERTFLGFAGGIAKAITGQQSNQDSRQPQ
jgi:hypothetical protein